MSKCDGNESIKIHALLSSIFHWVLVKKGTNQMLWKYYLLHQLWQFGQSDEYKHVQTPWTA